MKKIVGILSVLFFGMTGCDALEEDRNAKITTPGGNGSIEVDMENENDHAADRRACDELGDSEMMWHPNTSFDADIYVSLRPNEIRWELVFSGTVWAPIYVAAEHPALLYLNAPEAIQRIYQSQVLEPATPLQPEGWAEMEWADPVPVPQCPDLFRLELPADGDLFLLELQDVGDSIWAKVVPK